MSYGQVKSKKMKKNKPSKEKKNKGSTYYQGSLRAKVTRNNCCLVIKGPIHHKDVIIIYLYAFAIMT